MISIVVRTYNESKYLPLLLNNINIQEIDQEWEVIIVDSGSTDNTLEIAKNFDCEIVHILKEDFTFGRSLNYGCAKAKGDYLVFISAHCVPYDKNWLSNIVRPLIDIENTAMTYGRQIGYQTSKFSERQVFKKYFPENKNYEQGGYFCNNANSAIKKKLWEKYKFNEELTGLEDLDWAKQFYNKGYDIVYVPASIIHHIHEESWKKVMVRYEREAYALQEIMPEIHFTIFDFLRALIKGIINDTIIALKQKKFTKVFKSIIYFRFCQFYGAYKGNHIHRKLSKSKKQNYFYP